MKRLAFLCVGLLGLNLFSAPLSAQDDSIAQLIELAQKPGECFFDPPTHWWIIDPKVLPANVKILVKAPEANKYPPCANLAVDPVTCDLPTYLKRIKALNDAEGLIWKDLGSIDTKAGKASLSQVDTETNWGTIRMMHAIFIQNGQAHILTCAALKSEFPRHYSAFFDMMQSLRINPSLFQQISNLTRRESLETECLAVRKGYELLKASRGIDGTGLNPSSLFEADEFQSKYWQVFSDELHSNFDDMHDSWKNAVLAQVRRELISLD